MRKFVVPGIIVALLVAAAVVMFQSDERKTLTAHFPRTISIYEGSDVRVLGVPVGTVDSVTPSGTDVVVEMSYDAETKVPADASAVIVAPSIVGDRYVQLTPVYEGDGEVIADGAVLETDKTAVPLELDQIYSSMDDLTVALGPTGANSNGALSDLLETTAENFGGEGEKFHQTIEDFSRFVQTMDTNKEELFGSLEALQVFNGTLADNDQTVRQFNDSLSDVSVMLAGERQELKAMLRNLGTAMTQVSSFVRDNREILGRNIGKINRVAKVLVKQRRALDEILTAGPLALNNLALTYNPQAGTLDTRANQGEVAGEIEADPEAFLCGIAYQADKSGELCDVIRNTPANDLAELLQRPAFGAHGAKAPQERFDPSLGGLVEVRR